MPATSYYIIETEGRKDVVIALFGLDSQTDLIGEDDSGWWLNAHIAAPLEPDTYFVLIRQYRPKDTGEYKISVRAAE